MTVYLAANHAAAATGISTSCVESTTSATFDSNYTSSSMGFNNTAITTDAWTFTLTDPASGLATSLTAFSLHFEAYQTASSGAGVTMLQALNSAGTPVIQAVSTGSTSYKFQYWNGSAFVDTGVTFNHAAATRIIYDVIVVCGATGSLTLYQNSALVGGIGSISSASTNNVKSLAFHDTFTAGAGSFYSQILVKDAGTILRKVGDRAINATGNYSAWTGSATITNVNKVPYSDSTFISDNTNGDKASFKMAALTVTPTGLTIEALVICVRANNDGSGIANIQGFVRESSTDYPIGYNMSNVALGLSGNLCIFQNDPATSAPWAVAAVNSGTLEIGLIAET